MNGFEGILFAGILLAFLAGVFALIYKAAALYNLSRTSNPTQKSYCGIPHPRCLRRHSVCDI